MIRAYYDLAKPRMVYGNLLVAAAGFAYASQAIDWVLLLWTLAGLGCVIASACVFNNYFDRGIDAKMERTKHRALASGKIPNRNALLLGAVLLALGIKLLLLFTNLLTFEVALAGFLVYVLVYTPLKPCSPYALFVGAVAGATPPVVGYVAVTNTIDTTAWLFFLFLFVWQLPHFLAIAVYRHDEYAAAKVPLFMRGPYTPKQKKLARIIFYLSLVVLLGWCVALMVHK